MARRGILVLAAVLVALATLGGAAGCSDEHVERSSSPIINGTAVSSPETSRFVQVWELETAPVTIARNQASGVLLDGSTVLTCGHCLDNSLCPPAPATGNVTRGCRFKPSSHLVWRANGDPKLAGSAYRAPTRVSVHPMYQAFVGAVGESKVDIAILHLAQPYTVSGTLGVSTGTTASLLTTPTTTVTCYGYGLNTVTGGNKTLRSGVLGITSLYFDGWSFVMDRTSGGVVPYRGDSGGPCLLSSGTVAGMMRSVQEETDDAGTVTGVEYGTAVAAQAFRCWKDNLAGSFFDINEDMDLDGRPDSVAWIRDYPCGLFSPTGKCFAARIAYSAAAPGTPCNTLTLSMIPDLGQPIPSFDLATGDFNQDGAIDFIGQLAGIPFALNGIPGDLTQLASAGLTFLSSTYTKFYVADFDGDGVDDVEGLTANGYVDTYFGCPKNSTTCAPGLSEKFEVDAFPSPDRFDGKFTELTGTDNGTYPVPEMTIWIGSPGQDKNLSVDVFDGFFGSGHDRTFESGPADTCFRLSTDKYGNGTDLSQVAAVSGSEMRENEWSAVYRGPQDPKAKDEGSGDYWYRLEVKMGNCTGTIPPSKIAANAFKVRANSTVYPLGFSFWGRDRTGDWVPPVGVRPLYDTDYDGTFSFQFYVDESTTCIQLRDADADSANDESLPSHENIANDIFYFVQDEAGKTIFTNLNPSGQCSPSLGSQCDVELSPKIDVTPGWYWWTWKNVLSGNQVRVWHPSVPNECDVSTGAGGAGGAGGTGSTQPQSAEEQTAPGLPLYANLPRRVITHTSALPRSAWLAKSPSEIAPLLPIVLGSLNGCGKPIGGSTTVTTVEQANAILAGGKKNDRESELRAELLAAKLNLAFAASTGEPLANAFVYGSRSSVGSAVASADEVLARACPGLVCRHELGCGKTGPYSLPPGKGGSDSATKQELELTTRLLSMINARKLEYRAP